MNTYSYFREFLSQRNKGRVSKLLVQTGLKPTVNKKVKSKLKRGIVVFSADFEMSWAFRFSKTKRNDAIVKGLAERENIPKLLSLFELHNVPVTWATVGHLFLEECSRDTSGLSHTEMPRPNFFENKNWIFNSGDWYEGDPCSNQETHPAWYASDLVDEILKSKLNHELGCHTFSHIDFSDKNCSPDLARAELDASIKLAKLKGIKLKSMVFPGGTYGNFSILKEKEFLCYRKPTDYHIDLPFVDRYGLVAIPSSLSLDKDLYGWSKEFHIKMLRQFLKKVAKYKLVCHFWFHPSMDSWYLKNVMPEFLKMVTEFRDSEKFDIKTMGMLAEEILMEG